MRTFALTSSLLALAFPAMGASVGPAWLDYPASARALAQAGGLGVQSQGPESLGLNPAGLESMESAFEGQLAYGQWPASIETEGVLADWRHGNGALGLKFDDVDYGSIPTYGNNSQSGSTGSIHPYDLDAALGGAWNFGAVTAGVGMHWLSESLTATDSSSSPTFELGLKAAAGAHLDLGVSVLDLGGSLDQSALPTSFRGGICAHSAGTALWNAAVEASVPKPGSALAQPDVYFAASVQVAKPLILRAGYGALGNNQGEFESAGLSVMIHILSLDYGFRTGGSLGQVNEISIRIDL